MRIGIIGLGVVGNACKHGFTKQGHHVIVHDTKMDTIIDDVLDTDIIYVCVSTPPLPDGSIDQSSVFNTINLLDIKKYRGIVAIKSTVLPGTTEQLNTSTNLEICFVPEFLRERCANDDFINNHKLLAVGTNSDVAFNIVIASHGLLPHNIKQLTPTEAEILKYYNNVFNAIRVVFSNMMYELCQSTNSDYTRVLDAYLTRNIATDDYMHCNDSLRGYGGMCLPKDVTALLEYFKQNNINFDLLSAVNSDNNKLKTTTFMGMRQ